MKNPRKQPIVLILFALLAVSEVRAENSVKSVPYRWSNLPIGGGGYVIGGRAHPLKPNLVYVRTDIGGLYRWDHEQGRFVQLFTHVAPDQDNLFGIAGIALHPTDLKIVAAGAGKYDWGKGFGVFLSRDQGATWKDLKLPVEKPFAVNQNWSHRFGRPMEFRGADLWVGTRSDGVWIWNSLTSKWTQLVGVPRSANAIRNIIFDSNKPGSIYIVAAKVMYRSVDNGKSFQPIPLPFSGAAAVTDSKMDALSSAIYVSAMSGEPNGKGGGGLYRLDLTHENAQWQSIAPTRGNYKTVGVSSNRVGRMVAAPAVSKSGIEHFYRSQDGGENWERIPFSTSRPIQWHPERYTGTMISQIELQLSPKESPDVTPAFFTDWYGVWSTENVFAPTVHWTNQMTKGLEETVTLSLHSPRRLRYRVALYSGHADVSGFRHLAPFQIPQQNFAQAGGSFWVTATTGIDSSPSNPEMVVIAGSSHHGRKTEPGHGGVAISRDAGQTFQIATGYDPIWGQARVAVCAHDPKRIVVATASGNIRWTSDGGTTFHQATRSPGAWEYGLHSFVFNYTHALCADRVRAKTFYVFGRETGKLYVSHDGGESWRSPGTAIEPAPKGAPYVQLVADPYMAEHLWLGVAGRGLWRTADGGETWTPLETVADTRLLAIGQRRNSQTPSAIYLYGKLNPEEGEFIYRSEDSGETWEKINDLHNRIGCHPQVMAADREAFGRVYVGTNGTGVWVGESGLSPMKNPGF